MRQASSHGPGPLGQAAAAVPSSSSSSPRQTLEKPQDKVSHFGPSAPCRPGPAHLRTESLWARTQNAGSGALLPEEPAPSVHVGSKSAVFPRAGEAYPRTSCPLGLLEGSRAEQGPRGGRPPAGAYRASIRRVPAHARARTSVSGSELTVKVTCVGASLATPPHVLFPPPPAFRPPSVFLSIIPICPSPSV